MNRRGPLVHKYTVKMADAPSLDRVYHYHHHRHVCCAYLTPFYLGKVQSRGTS